MSSEGFSQDRGNPKENVDLISFYWLWRQWKWGDVGKECFDHRSLQKKNREKTNSTSKERDVASLPDRFVKEWRAVLQMLPTPFHSTPPHSHPRDTICFLAVSHPWGFHPFPAPGLVVGPIPFPCFQLNHLIASKPGILNFCTIVMLNPVISCWGEGGDGGSCALWNYCWHHILSPLDVSMVLSYSPNRTISR